MVRKILESCPSCGGELEIAEVHCTQCETQIRARYRPCDFCALTEEQSTFLKIFVTSRGNLSEVEKRLGVSYPTVRAKLDEVIGRLAPPAAGPPPPPPPGSTGPKRRPAAEPQPSSPNPSGRRQILEAVARGEISPAEGIVRMRALGDNDEDEASGTGSGSA